MTRPFDKAQGKPFDRAQGKQMAVRAALAVLLAGIAAEAGAQSVLGGAAWMSGWDDETMLGRGVMWSGGFSQPLGSHLAVEGELAAGRQLRDSGYLAAEGTPLAGTGRIAYLFQKPGSRARAFASAGGGFVHSTGTLTTRSIVRGPGGLPVQGPSDSRDWSLTQPSFELGTGVSIKAGERLSIRPEFRWLATIGQDSNPRSTLEPPLLFLRGGVTLEWRLR